MLKFARPFNIVLTILISILFLNLRIYSQPVDIWLTTGDQSQKLSPQATVNFAPDAGSFPLTVNVDENTIYQQMDGFGFTLTEGSAEVINSLESVQQNALLNDLFNPSSAGISLSFIRLPMGASDLGSSIYTYDQTSGDVNMNNFSLAGPDLTYLIPVLKKILLINPAIKILAVPWTAPLWMKTNNSSSGGSLQTQYYTPYAKYFVKYLQAMQAQGITIWGITPQNEPENSSNNPSMTMNANSQIDFLNNDLGPAIASAGFSPKIIVFDHNCSNTAYPISVLNNSQYAEGASFHLYQGNISAMTTVHNATNKSVYFTEQYTGAGGDFGGDLKWHLQNVVIGSARNWSKTVLEWNLANNASVGPHTNGGCSDCLGAVTVNNSNTYTKNLAYYIIGHISKVVKDGAVRIASNFTGNIQNVAFKNPDSMIAMVFLNTGSSASTFKVIWRMQSFTYTLPGGAAASFKWRPPSTVPVRLLSFTALKQNRQAVINFVTASEISNDYFNIERSSDGLNFTTINKLNAKGSESSGASYSFTDEHTVSGLNYYRLQQVDKNGKITFSKIEVLNFLKNNSFVLFPNPVIEDMSFEVSSDKVELIRFRLYNALGNLVYNNIINTNKKVYLPVLTSGMYVYDIISDRVTKIRAINDIELLSLKYREKYEV